MYLTFIIIFSVACIPQPASRSAPFECSKLQVMALSLSSLLQATSELGSLDVLYSTTLIWNYRMLRAYNASLNPFNVVLKKKNLSSYMIVADSSQMTWSRVIFGVFKAMFDVTFVE